MSKRWTPEKRRKQAEAIRRWRPWAQSTGPITVAGKSRCSVNAFKGGVRPTLRQIARAMRNQSRMLGDL